MNKTHSAMLRPHASKLAVIHRLADCAIIALTLYGACAIYGIEFDTKYALAALGAAIMFAFAAELSHLYGSWRIYSLGKEAMELLMVCILVGFGMTSIAFLAKASTDFSRVTIVIWGTLSYSILLAERVAARALLRAARKHGRNTRSLAIAGVGPSARNVAQQVNAAEWAGLLVTGFYADGAAVGTEPAPDAMATVKGDLSDLIQAARAGEVDYIYVALPTREEERILWLVNQLADTTVSVFVVPDLFIFQLAQARWTSINGMPIVSVYESPFEGVNGWLKRAEDVVLGSLILLLALVPMLLIAIILKLSSPGSILFKQRRYGLNGKVVEIWKFRTMRVSDDGEVVAQATKQDARVTAFGAFLRRTSLDELPQFFNVLGGDMSIVGPRPHAVAHNEQYRGLIPGYMLRHKVKPGITGWAQINGWRGETDTLEKMQKRVEFDLVYMRNWSLWLDLKIILLTVLKGFYSRNAY